MRELTEKQKLAYSIPGKKRVKSKWCKGFIIAGTQKDEAQLCREETLRRISTRSFIIKSRRYSE